MGALAQQSRHDPRDTTRAARRAFLERKFEDEVDPDRILPEAERERRARAALRLHMSRLAAKRWEGGKVKVVSLPGLVRLLTELSVHDLNELEARCYGSLDPEKRAGSGYHHPIGKDWPRDREERARLLRRLNALARVFGHLPVSSLHKSPVKLGSGTPLHVRWSEEDTPTIVQDGLTFTLDTHAALLVTRDRTEVWHRGR